MLRIRLLDTDSAAGDAKLALEFVPVKLNVFKVMAHAETTMVPHLQLGAAILSAQQLSHKSRELLILLMAHLEGSAYEWNQHRPIAEGVGVAAMQIDAIEHGDITAGAFNDAERSLLAFGKQVIEQVRVDDPVFADAKRYYSEREIVEAILVIGYYMTMARLTEATQTPVDPAAGMALFNAAQQPVPELRTGTVNAPDTLGRR
jgi:alkylhydroperoxidase family enzyme